MRQGDPVTCQDKPSCHIARGQPRNNVDAAELDRWTKYERANIACFRMDLDEAKAAR
jgi:hypothetical protein